jgi:VPDSG-CTERM motif
MLVGIGIVLAAQAKATVMFTFLENGSGNKGPSETWTVSGLSLTAYGFNASGATDLWAKNGGPGENGLGLAEDPTGDHEISTFDFVQLKLPTTPPSTFLSALLASVQNGEEADIYWSTTLGSLGTMIGSISNSDGTFFIPSGQYQNGYFGVTAGHANVLLAGAVFEQNVPDGGTTIMLLGGALVGIQILRRKLGSHQA